ncbi:MAG: TlpA disulfide reductase family protein [Bacteroidota bacterium]
MKKNYIYLLAFATLCLMAFLPAEVAKKVKLSVELRDCSATDSLFLYQFEGFGFSKLQTAASKKAGNYEFRLPTGEAKFYFIGKNPQQVKPILLGTEPDVKVKGTCGDLSKALIGSKLNQDYEKLVARLNGLKQEMAKKIQEVQQAQNDESAQRMAIFEMSEIDDKRMAVLNEFKNRGDILAEVAAINTYLSFQNNGGDYYSEVDYFASEFFRFADFSNPVYEHNPWVYENFKEYAATLASVGIELELQQSYLNEALAKVPANSKAHQLALTGVVMGLDEKRQKNYVIYGKRLLKKYGDAYPELTAGLKQRINGVGPISDGELAPDFTQKTPHGTDLKLSDLRGKVVLVDFWASWCGPCRRENPHVKALYEKYSDKGFEILSVSLDRQEASWKRAIEQDGMDWFHVSDLKGWKNEVAKLYSVSSIPYTVLLDPEGRIIARKLRAVQLEQVLSQLFGS